MKLIFFLTLTISYIALSKAITPYEAAYRLVLGPLEIFLKSAKNDIMGCYGSNRKEYEDSLNSFSERVKQIQHLFKTAFPIAKPFGDFMWKGWTEMKYISDNLERFIKEFNKKITDGKLYDGGNEMASKRAKVEGHYKLYEKHGNDLKKVHRPYHNQTFLSTMDEAIEKVYKNTIGITDKVLGCLKSKGVTYTKNK